MSVIMSALLLGSAFFGADQPAAMCGAPEAGVRSSLLESTPVHPEEPLSEVEMASRRILRDGTSPFDKLRASAPPQDERLNLTRTDSGAGERAATVRLETGPTLRIIPSTPPVSMPGEVWRASDGLFYVDATVNGAPVRFLVDTGATTVVLTPEDAHRAGIMPEDTHFNVKADTANGGAAMAWVTLDHVNVAGTSAQGLRAAVAGTGLGVSLLGQSWLSQLDSVTIEGDRMTLR
jgi:aspartyl protease family protein